mmetsp:Transcript_10279/g.30397  ORF Transcript_10279/g.30397 Transcript_10279/m.30397 type:complete len:326 (-) Transcript_10279:678-1655(-)
MGLAHGGGRADSSGQPDGEALHDTRALCGHDTANLSGEHPLHDARDQHGHRKGDHGATREHREERDVQGHVGEEGQDGWDQHWPRSPGDAWPPRHGGENRAHPQDGNVAEAALLQAQLGQSGHQGLQAGEQAMITHGPAKLIEKVGVVAAIVPPVQVIMEDRFDTTGIFYSCITIHFRTAWIKLSCDPEAPLPTDTILPPCLQQELGADEKHDIKNHLLVQLKAFQRDSTSTSAAAESSSEGGSDSPSDSEVSRPVTASSAIRRSTLRGIIYIYATAAGASRGRRRPRGRRRTRALRARRTCYDVPPTSELRVGSPTSSDHTRAL